MAIPELIPTDTEYFLVQVRKVYVGLTLATKETVTVQLVPDNAS